MSDLHEPDGGSSTATRQWMTSSQVAQALGVHRQTVWNIPRDTLPYDERGGRKVRCYDPAKVTAYLALRTVVPDESLAGMLAEHARLLSDHEVRLSAVEGRLAG